MTDIYTVNKGCVSLEFLVLGPIENNTFIISDDAATFVVDPSSDVDAILSALGGRKPEAIVLTHRHHDHVDVAAALRRATGAPVIASAIDAGAIEHPSREGEGSFPSAPPCPVDQRVSDGDTIAIGNMSWKVIATPGHTEGSICLYLDPKSGADTKGAPVLISGDTLFFGSIGRTDFKGGSMSDMRTSLKRLAQLPDNTLVLPGHNNLTTIGAERGRVFARY